MTTDSQVLVCAREVDGRSAYILDEIFQPDIIQMLYELLRRLPFSLTEFDTAATKQCRHWNYEFPLEALTADPVFRIWHGLIVAKTVELFPKVRVDLKRVHCNSHLYGDFQNAHTDLVPGITSLYFANSEWNDNWHGETILYNNSGEPIYAVAPKPGRLLMFAGDILHRGGVPSRACFEPRLSVAFKFKTTAQSQN